MTAFRPAAVVTAVVTAAVIFAVAPVPAGATTATTRASVATGGAQGDAASHGPSLSSDGRYVAFTSSATNLVRGDTNGVPDVFVRDRSAGVTTRVSVASDGTQGNGPSGATAAYGSRVAVSGNGRYITYESDASKLAGGDNGVYVDVFLYNRSTRRTTRVSAAGDGTDGDSFRPAISADGRYVTYSSWASNLVANDTNYARDVFLSDQRTQRTTLVSAAADGAPASFDSQSFDPAISANGQYITYTSDARNLVPGDTNDRNDVFLYQRP
jgi:Tol biopolymer transport system component